jgi:hypothetical protein
MFPAAAEAAGRLWAKPESVKAKINKSDKDDLNIAYLI